MVAITAIHAGTPSQQLRLLQARATLARQEAEQAQSYATQLRRRATEAEQSVVEKRVLAQGQAQKLRQAQNDASAGANTDTTWSKTSFLERQQSAHASLDVDEYTQLERLKAKPHTPTRSELLHISV